MSTAERDRMGNVWARPVEFVLVSLDGPENLEGGGPRGARTRNLRIKRPWLGRVSAVRRPD